MKVISETCCVDFERHLMKVISETRRVDFECTWWRLFQKRVVLTRFDIYVFID